MGAERINYMKFPKKYLFLTPAIVVVFVMPLVSQAAVFLSLPPSSAVGSHDTFIVHEQLNTQGQTINVVEGAIQITGDAAQVFQISLGGSDFTLWPKSPVVSSANNITTISFTGGVPGGFNKNNAQLFDIIFTASKPGKLSIVPLTITAYENDGKGTKAQTTFQQLDIPVIANGAAPTNSWQTLLSQDKTSPNSFVITLGQDNNTYGGKKFITFQTTDGQSGMDYYEVQEGNLPPVRASSPYVLQDQTAKSPIKVKAYDKAGNFTLVTWMPPVSPTGKTGNKTFWIWIISAIILVAIFLFFRNKTKKVNELSDKKKN